MFPIQFPPGIVRDATEYATGGRWYDANLVRWYAGQARPVGGWSAITDTPLTGKCREMIAWRTNSNATWAAFGTSQKLYVTRFSGSPVSVYDITPVGFTAGSDDHAYGVGYGTGPYGEELYGTPRTTPAELPLSSWHLDTWGENLVGCMRGDGKLYEWTLSTGTPAAVIANAPTGCLGVMVTEQRHVMALGADLNPRKLKWSDKEDNTTWTPSTTNEAGSIELQTAGTIRRGLKVLGQNLILTDIDAHVAEYIGFPLIYSRRRVGVDCGVIGAGAACGVESFGAWMGPQGFWLYDGSVQPLPCDVADYVFTRLNRSAAEKVACGHNGAFGEIWWFYPSGNDTEPNSYVAWNYRERHWTIGELDRTAWIDAGVFANPLAVGTDNHVYRHEDGLLANGVTRVGDIYLRSGAIDIDDGEQIIHVRKTLPDEKASGAVSVTFKVRMKPNGTEYTKGPFIVRADGQTDSRFSARQLSVLLTPVNDSDWRIGKFRFEGTVGGRR
jgi:hypothetical protein